MKLRRSGSRAIPAFRSPALRGAPGGNRTPNLLVRSQTLYPLSYGRSETAYRGGPGSPMTGGDGRIRTSEGVLSP
jgi:hypothetical protein